MIEAMACGTPVIAFRRGSVPEVIDDGISGFIVDSEEEALAAIRRIGTLDRRAVRAAFERRFTARRMANDYLRHYQALATGPRPRRGETELELSSSPLGRARQVLDAHMSESSRSPHRQADLISRRAAYLPLVGPSPKVLGAIHLVIGRPPRRPRVAVHVAGIAHALRIPGCAFAGHLHVAEKVRGLA